jgi:hypothetical protein
LGPIPNPQSPIPKIAIDQDYSNKLKKFILFKKFENNK